jgi:hypothetical protein
VFDTPATRRRLWYAGSAFFAVWVPTSIILGVRWGRSLRFPGDNATHTGPIIEGVMQFALVMLVPALFVALAVFVAHAVATER